MPDRHRAFFGGFRSLRKAELHIHLEGSISASTLVGISRQGSSRFANVAAVRERRELLPGRGGFLDFYRDVCRELRNPRDYARVARDVTRRLHREGILHAEVYVSPVLVERIGLEWGGVRDAVESVFATHERLGRGRIVVLLDTVRQWGPDAAHRVLDLLEARPWPRARGFGLGGDELSVPLREFRSAFRRAGRLGLFPLVHAGEWAGADAVAEAVDLLRPHRIAHGVRAIDEGAVVRLLARRGIALDICLTSNEATGAVPPGVPHPIRRLLAAGIPVTLGTDDPGLFGTTLRREYQRLAGLGATLAELRAVLGNAWRASLPALRRRRPAHRSKDIAPRPRRH